MKSLAATLPSTNGTRSLPIERRVAVRQMTHLEALSRPLATAESICWGAVVQDISPGGLGLLICYPFKPGVHLAVDVRKGNQQMRSLTVRVVHVTDQTDGTWFIGCEFPEPLTAEELQELA